MMAVSRATAKVGNCKLPEVAPAGIRLVESQLRRQLLVAVRQVDDMKGRVEVDR